MAVFLRFTGVAWEKNSLEDHDNSRETEKHDCWECACQDFEHLYVFLGRAMNHHRQLDCIEHFLQINHEIRDVETHRRTKEDFGFENFVISCIGSVFERWCTPSIFIYKAIMYFER
jgi:hypothetical protein